MTRPLKNAAMRDFVQAAPKSGPFHTWLNKNAMAMYAFVRPIFPDEKEILRALFEISILGRILDDRHDGGMLCYLAAKGLAKERGRKWILAEAGKEVLKAWDSYNHEGAYFYVVGAKRLATAFSDPKDEKWTLGRVDPSKMDGEDWRFGVMNRNELALNCADNLRYDEASMIRSLIGEAQRLAGLQ